PYYDPPLLHPHHAPPPPHTPPLSLHDALPISPDHTCGRSWMPRQPLPQRAIGNPPQVQAPIIATTDHPGAVRAPVYIVDDGRERDRKSTRLNSSHVAISYAVFCLKKKKYKRRT